MPLLITAPLSIWARNFAGTASRPFASIVCSYSPRNISVPYATMGCYSAVHTKYSKLFSLIQEHLAFSPHISNKLTIIPHLSPLDYNRKPPAGERVLSTNFLQPGG